jgi:hypothetical protein
VQWARNEAASNASTLEFGLLVRAPVLHRVELSRCPTNQHLATVDSHGTAIVVCKLGFGEGGMKIRHTSLLFSELLRGQFSSIFKW